MIVIEHGIDYSYLKWFASVHEGRAFYLDSLDLCSKTVVMKLKTEKL